MKKLLALVGATIAFSLAGCATTPAENVQAFAKPQPKTEVTPQKDDDALPFDLRAYESIQAATNAAAKILDDPNNTIPLDEIMFQLVDACVGYMSEVRPYMTAMAMAEPNLSPADYDKHVFIATRTRELYIEKLALLEEFVEFGARQANTDFDTNLETYGEVMSVCVTVAMSDRKFLDILRQVQAEYMKDKQGI